MMLTITKNVVDRYELEVLELTEKARAGLWKIVEKERDWRMRHRALTLPRIPYPITAIMNWLV